MPITPGPSDTATAVVLPLRRPSAGHRQPQPYAMPPALLACVTPIRTALEQGWDAWATRADDALFQRSENGERATDFFDAMRTLRRQRPHLEQVFKNHQQTLLEEWMGVPAHDMAASNVQRVAAAASAGAIQKPQDVNQDINQKSTSSSSPGPRLELVSNDDLEVALGLDAMITRANRDGGPAWARLRQRLAHALARPDDRPLPFGPEGVSSSFDVALSSADWETAPRLVLMKLFEREAMPLLAAASITANTNLIEMGVLVNLAVPSQSPRQVGSAGVSTMQGQPSQPTQAAAAFAADARTSSAWGELVEAVVRSSPMQEQQVRGANGSALLDGLVGSFYQGQNQPDEILMALAARLASQETVSPSVPLTPALLQALISLRTMGDGDMVSPKLLRQWGHSRAAAMEHNALAETAPEVRSTAAATRVAHEHAIDLVSMVFDFIQHDGDLPEAMQVDLAKLQIPYLRVALLDPHGFAKADHPARRLLENLAAQARSWGRDGPPPKDRTAIEETVSAIAHADDSDLDVFDRQNSLWESKLASQAARTRAAERRAVAANHGTDRRLAAQARLTRDMASRLSGLSLPGSVQHVLNCWGQVMLLALLRDGAPQAAYQSMLTVVDAVAAVTNVGPASRADVQALAPILEDGWRALDLGQQAGLYSQILTEYMESASPAAQLMPALPVMEPIDWVAAAQASLPNQLVPRAQAASAPQPAATIIPAPVSLPAAVAPVTSTDSGIGSIAIGAATDPTNVVPAAALATDIVMSASQAPFVAALKAIQPEALDHATIAMAVPEDVSLAASGAIFADTAATNPAATDPVATDPIDTTLSVSSQPLAVNVPDAATLDMPDVAFHAAHTKAMPLAGSVLEAIELDASGVMPVDVRQDTSSSVPVAVESAPSDSIGQDVSAAPVANAISNEPSPLVTPISENNLSQTSSMAPTGIDIAGVDTADVGITDVATTDVKTNAGHLIAASVAASAQMPALTDDVSSNTLSSAQAASQSILVTMADSHGQPIQAPPSAILVGDSEESTATTAIADDVDNVAIATSPSSSCEPITWRTGDWVSLSLDDRQCRGKLSWQSPFTGRWLIVSAQGHRLTEMSVPDMSEWLADGRMERLMDVVPGGAGLFSAAARRALSGA